MISIITACLDEMYQKRDPINKSGYTMIRRTLCTIMALSALPATAQHAHGSSDRAVETGQSAFAAISEIVQILSDTPNTDWAKVDIQAVRDHLVDMDMVTTQAIVNTRTQEHIVEFIVTGEGDVADAIERMTIAHSPMLEAATGWRVTAQPSLDGATMRIEVDTDQALSRVLGLGFFGVLTIGAHHQAHHMQMALGDGPHH